MRSSAGRDGQPGGVELRWILRQDRRHRVGGGFSLEGPLAAQHLVEHGAERKDVGAMVDGQAAHLLGRHVAERPEHGAGVGLHVGDAGFLRRRRRDRLGETEVEDLDVIVAPDHDVLGLQIAMDDAARVGGGDAARDLLRVGRRRAAATADRSRGAFEASRRRSAR